MKINQTSLVFPQPRPHGFSKQALRGEGKDWFSLDNRDLTKLRRQRQRQRQKAIGLVSKTATLHMHTLFCTFLCRPRTTTKWNDQILIFF